MKRIAVLAILLLAVAAAAPSECLLTFQTESIPDFHLGQPIHFQLEGVSGTEPYTFTLVGGSLPNGVHLHSNGKITGVPKQELDTVILVNLTDAAGCQINQAFTFRVTP